MTWKDYTVKELTKADRTAVIDVMNHFVRTSFAAYSSTELEYRAFDRLLTASDGYPRYTLCDHRDNMVGFAMLRRWLPADSFDTTCEITYFILPGHTGRGLGCHILGRLTDDAYQMGIRTILASISSLNEQSLRFHAANGLVDSGRFKSVGHKQGRDFDVVWMQRML